MCQVNLRGRASRRPEWMRSWPSLRRHARMPAVFDRFRVIVVTPAGRERYMRLLASHVLHSPLVDEWHLWLNTREPADLAYMRGLAEAHTPITKSLSRIFAAALTG